MEPSLLSVRNKRDADVDLYMKRDEFRIQLAATNRNMGTTIVKFDMEKLKDRDPQQQFASEVRNKYQVLRIMGGDSPMGDVGLCNCSGAL